MHISPLRDLVVVQLREEPDEQLGLVVVTQNKTAIRRGTVTAVGPECRDISVGQGVVINLLVASQVNDQYLVREPQVLATV